MGFIIKYFPHLREYTGVLNTPVIVVKRNKKPVRWYYTLTDDIKVGKNEVSKYYKGLGTFKKEDLQEIVKQEGLENMIEMIDFDDTDLLRDWLDPKLADKRKEYIMKNDFNIAKV